MKTVEMFKILSEITGQGRILTMPRIFVERTGSHAAAVLLAQALYWHTTQADSEGWVKKSDAEVYNEILIKRDLLVSIRDTLKEFGLVHARRGMPASSHYKVDIELFFRSFGADDAFLDSINPLNSQNQTCSGNYPNQDWGYTPNRTPEICVPDVIHEPPSLISINTLEKKGGVSTGDLIGATLLPDPRNEVRQGLVNTMEVFDRVFQALPTQTRAKLNELQRQSKRSRDQFMLWVREFVAPEMDRLGSNFPSAVEAAVKAAILANPNYCLADFVKSISSALPPQSGTLTKAKASEATEDALQLFIRSMLDEAAI